MIKNIVFDMGSVILRGVPKDTINGFDNYELLSNYFDKINECDYGKITLKEVFDNCKIPSIYSDKLLNYFKYRKLNNSLLELIKILKNNNNYNVYILSDNNYEAYEYYKNSNLFNNIDGWVVSCSYGCLKKEGKLFDIFLNKYNLNSSECYFIDDNINNINMAKNKGFITYLFNENDDVNLLINDMKNKGIEGI